MTQVQKHMAFLHRRRDPGRQTLDRTKGGFMVATVEFGQSHGGCQMLSLTEIFTTQYTERPPTLNVCCSVRAANS